MVDNKSPGLYRELRNGKKIPLRRLNHNLKKRFRDEEEEDNPINYEIVDKNSSHDIEEEEKEKVDADVDEVDRCYGEDDNEDEAEISKSNISVLYADLNAELGKIKGQSIRDKLLNEQIPDVKLNLKSDIKSGTSSCIFFATFAIIIVIAGVVFNFWTRPTVVTNDNQTEKIVRWKKAFADLLDNYGTALPEISRKVIDKSIQRVLVRQTPSLKFNDVEPSVILFIGSNNNSEAVKCISLELSRSLSKVFDENQSPPISADKLTKIDLNNEFHQVLGHQGLHTIILDGIERLTGFDALSLHPFTDHNKASYLDVIILLTAYSDSHFTNASLNVDQIDNIANGILEISWDDLPKDQVAALLSRLTPSVAIVLDTDESKNWYCV